MTSGNEFLDLVLARGLRILFITLIAILAYVGLRYVIRILTANIQRIDGEADSEFDFRVQTILRFVRSVGIVIIVATAILTILSELDINVAPLIASVGVAGLALGLGAQTLVKDAIAGMFILMEDQFHVGDSIKTAGISGAVEGLSLRTTSIRDLNGTLHIVPNGEIRIVSNSSAGWSRARLELLIPYEHDVSQVMDELRSSLAELRLDDALKLVLLDDFSVTGPEELAEWGQRVRILAKVRPGQQWGVQRKLREHVLDTLNQHDITLAKPRSEIVVIEPQQSGAE